ncbi:hypothetical protein IKF67_00040 [Candidatus Saccharibacteria bacterium]|nr:hypothetical protein [Candidatus Saccharibacteria bacterium]
MQLIVILLGTVSVLTFLSGLIVFLGAKKGSRAHSAWFFSAAIFATVWMISICLFLTAKPDRMAMIDWHVKWTFASAILLDASFLGYVAWKEKYGKILTSIFLVLGLLLVGTIFLKPELLYKEVILANTGNSVVMNISALYFAYIAFFGLIVPAIIIYLLKQFIKTRSDRTKGGDLVIMLSFGGSSTIVLIVNLIMPLFGNWSMIWLGPLALSATIIGFYYTILKYKSLNLASAWLKIFSYIVIFASLAIVYMIIFSLIFAALFRGSTPSIEVIILNFLMVIVFLVLMPAINRVMVDVHSQISGSKTKVSKGDNEHA